MPRIWLSPELSFVDQQPAALLGLFIAGFVASSINAVAGGGSLMTFPLFVAFGVPALSANATTAVALWPGSLASAFGYRDQQAAAKKNLPYLAPPTILGGLVGAWLLTHTPARLFHFVVPVLILLATSLLAFQSQIREKVLGTKTRLPLPAGIFLQFLLSIYGGYFGAGMGIIMLALFGLFVEGTLHEHNALKNSLAVTVNIVASLFFLQAGLLWIIPGVFCMAGAITGGYLSARLATKIDPVKLRRVIVALGLTMTAWFFWQAWQGA
ncbi:MAG TPA: sulfite exporter TauE/SafE family protein [Polyangium sp.]|jgi:uncharacterized membrane protein YfcA|nr:sulfite exporter TauE/SafE family protein [Polyangium sp.]